MFPIIETEEVNIKMIKSVRIFLSACFTAVMLPAAGYGAAAFPDSIIHTAEDGEEDRIMLIEEEPVLDDSGNGKKLDAGAALTIPEMGGQVYLDFHKPDHGGGSAVKQFILSNLLFIPIALFLYACYRWYETCFLH